MRTPCIRPHVTELYFDDFVLSGSTGIGTHYCQATVNSTGAGAAMGATGSTTVANNNFTLSAQPVPNQPGLFFYAANQTQVPFGNGFRCVDGFFSRLDVENATNNVITHQVDFQNPPTAMGLITAGSTWNFQAWYRDPNAGGAFFNLSDGLQVTFQ
ncbi:MAG: hypothetical protein E2O39_12725 [Planctomycetota bacterium]|nr:MAG: hypothetical protein E2O39_12725 [Planctomycetota bacterium]